MLSLGRNPGQYVVIGDHIVIQVISIDGVLRLAIEAPKEMPILRGENYELNNPIPACVLKKRNARPKKQKNI